MNKNQLNIWETGQLDKSGQNPVFERNSSIVQDLQTGHSFPEGESEKKGNSHES